jgi:hypothetical protein
MNEFSPEQDELSSAYLDDEATPEERARVESDPALLARAEELRSVRDALAVPVTPPPAADRDARISAALRASGVVDLDRARGRRRLRIASIAAAVVLVLGAAGVLIRSADQDTKKFAAVSGSIGSASDQVTAEKAATGAGGAGTAAAPLSTAAARAPLGSFADRAALVAAVQSQVDRDRLQSKQAQPTTTAALSDAAGGPAPPSCSATAPPDAIDQVYAATAVLGRGAVQVDVFTVGDGSNVLVVTDVADCTELFTQRV